MDETREWVRRRLEAGDDPDLLRKVLEKKGLDSSIVKNAVAYREAKPEDTRKKYFDETPKKKTKKFSMPKLPEIRLPSFQIPSLLPKSKRIHLIIGIFIAFFVAIYMFSLYTQSLQAADTLYVETPPGIAEQIHETIIQSSPASSPLMGYIYADSIGSTASGSDNTHFNRPTGVTVDSKGNVYVVDRFNHRVQVYLPGGGYKATFGGCGCDMTYDPELCEGQCSGKNDMSNPYDVAVDSRGIVYVSDTSNHRIQVYDWDLNHVTVIGGEGRGSWMNQFDTPLGVAVDSADNLYVADSANNRVQVFDKTLNYLTTLGGNGRGKADNQFDLPSDVSVDAKGRIYVADTLNFRIQMFDRKRQYIQTFGGSELTKGGQLVRPESVAVDEFDNVYITDWMKGRVQVFDPDAAHLDTIGGCPCVPAPSNEFCRLSCQGNHQLNRPYNIHIDRSSQKVYIADSANNRIQILKLIEK